MATFQRLYTAAWYILDKVLTVFWHLEYLSCRKWSSLNSVCAHTESISVVRMKHLHYKCCHEGNIVLLLSTVNLSHTNPILRNDAIPVGGRGWDPAYTSGSGSDCRNTDIFWCTGRSYAMCKTRSLNSTLYLFTLPVSSVKKLLDMLNGPVPTCVLAATRQV